MLALSAQRHGGKCGLALAPGLIELRRYHGYRDMRPRAVRATRLASGDSMAVNVSQIAQDILLYVVPVLMLLLGIARQVFSGRFDVALTLQVFLAALAYVAGTLLFARHRPLCQFRPWVAWLYPVGALMRLWFRMLAIGERLGGREVTWKGRGIPVPIREG